MSDAPDPFSPDPTSPDPTSPDGAPDDELESFWSLARFHARLNSLPGYLGTNSIEALRPPAWAFGANREQADELAALVVDGTKTATAGALWDYEAAGESVPEDGEMSIILDGSQHPVALIVTTDVSIVPFDEVSAEHAYAEGEGDRSLAYWREVHETFFTEVAVHDRSFSPDMPVVLETFRVVYTADDARGGDPDGPRDTNSDDRPT